MLPLRKLNNSIFDTHIMSKYQPLILSKTINLELSQRLAKSFYSFDPIQFFQLQPMPGQIY